MKGTKKNEDYLLSAGGVSASSLRIVPFTEARESIVLSGIVINPNSEAFAMRKELLYVILNLLKNEDSEA